VLDVEVIEQPAVAVTALDPVRARILAALSEPGSATSVAQVLGEPRQKVNYHLRMLEEHGLVHLLKERQRRGLTERVMIASARSYVVASDAFGDSAVEPDRVGRWSSRYLVAVAARMVREVAELARRADEAQQPLATLAIDTEIRFSSAQDRAAFTNEISRFVADLAAHYHDESAPDGRWHRLVVAAHAHPTPPQNQKD
jgi:DNA-binding transcriptional ArsR family regulator